ncbi:MULTISPECIES: phosphate/phosphite/phosphonate ABC transporter substrate-binding protein [Pandoraea]|uniref:phosphate/phosphite/phosphonate ABC transporter substrate-binding protein n=1 Tax=Pandoraea TaxID=93217 RepID=UPI0008472CE8|nr:MULTISPECIES: phosphate/phosphite/phosphonate ABC transporter substrate-binding protein [Pandoraea]MCI3208010.1 phosphate/phosphite/phosphonate ABC transporter substrate-binding protein [Pandoraea sp. LA3]MDN4586039.1 phosphate/phosphite/phosphonate ABC transporter substrate-binding protein [Pandoraea capi]ODP32913.1 phosphonate ABC transporter substrate-binding protein [Pandoraea sp. ISTKB]
MKAIKRFAAVAFFAAVASGAAHAAGECPNNGVVRFGVEPYESSARMLPVYTDLAKLIGDKLGCKVELYIATSYNAEIEAMRNNKLEFAQFGPLGYVLAHQVAHAEAVATFANENGSPQNYYASIVTWPGSSVKTLADTAGKSFAYADPASTSGHLFPAYGLRKNGIDPDKGVKAIYAGSHTASFEALRNHKVEAGELNSEEISSARLHGEYDDKAYVTLWKSDPIPVDPMAVRGDLPAEFKTRLAKILSNLDLKELPEADQKFMAANATPALKTVPQTDAAYNQIRDLVSTLHIDLSKL